jgi:tetratricopeptide (TPR) repeat protein
VGQDEFFRKFGLEAMGFVIVGFLGLLAAGATALLLKRFPELGETSQAMAALLVGGAVLVFAWFYWRRRSAARRAMVGVASGTKPAVLLASLAGDRDNVRQLEIDRFIRRIFEERIEVLVCPDQFDPGLGNKETRDASLRASAEEWLARTNCQVLIFGKTSQTGATHLSLFSRSRGVEELRGLAGEFLDLDQDISDQIAQHVAGQVATIALDEAGSRLSFEDLGIWAGIIDTLLPSARDTTARYSLLNVKATILGQKGKRETGSETLVAAREVFTEALASIDQDARPCEWSSTKLNILTCDLLIGLRTGERGILRRSVRQLERDSSEENGLPCAHCRKEASKKLLQARSEMLSRFWDEGEWQDALAESVKRAEKFSVRTDDQYWNARGIILTLAWIGVRNLDVFDELRLLADPYCEDALAIPGAVSPAAREHFIGVAAVVCEELFNRTGTENYGQKAIKLLDERLSYLSVDHEPANWAEAMSNKCLILSSIGRHQMTNLNLRRAIECGEEAVKVLGESGDSDELARAKNNLGGAYDYLARRDMTRELFEAALALKADAAFVYARLGRRSDTAHSRMNVALSKCDLAAIAWKEANSMNDIEAAEECFSASARQAEKAVRFLETRRPQHELAMSLANFSYIYRTRAVTTGDYSLLEEAMDCCRRGLALPELRKFDASWRLLSFNLAGYLFEVGSRTGDKTMLAEARSLYEEFAACMQNTPGDSMLLHARQALAALTT